MLTDQNMPRMDGMSVGVGEEIYIIPIGSVIESFQVPRVDWEKISGTTVIIEADGARIALLVDELVGQHQVVVKNLEANYRKVPGVSGATILGDGRVALILDTNALVKRSRHQARITITRCMADQQHHGATNGTTWWVFKIGRTPFGAVFQAKMAQTPLQPLFFSFSCAAG